MKKLEGILDGSTHPPTFPGAIELEQVYMVFEIKLIHQSLESFIVKQLLHEGPFNTRRVNVQLDNDKIVGLKIFEKHAKGVARTVGVRVDRNVDPVVGGLECVGYEPKDLVRHGRFDLVGINVIKGHTKAVIHVGQVNGRTSVVSVKVQTRAHVNQNGTGCSCEGPANGGKIVHHVIQGEHPGLILVCGVLTNTGMAHRCEQGFYHSHTGSLGELSAREQSGPTVGM